jgi:hypothetical protein
VRKNQNPSSQWKQRYNKSTIDGNSVVHHRWLWNDCDREYWCEIYVHEFISEVR